MDERDFSDLKFNKLIEPEATSNVESIMPGFNLVLQLNHTVRKLIFDYALIAAILGLFRFNNPVGDLLNFSTLLLLNLLMAVHIGHFWKTFKNRKIVTITNLSLSFLCSFIIAILVRSIFSIFTLFIPLLVVLNASVGHAVLTFLFGRATNQLYLSAKRIDRKTLEEILNTNKNHSNHVG